MRINVIRLRRDAKTEQISDRTFVVEADTLEALVVGVQALDDIDPLGDPHNQQKGTPDE